MKKRPNFITTMGILNILVGIGILGVQSYLILMGIDNELINMDIAVRGMFNIYLLISLLAIVSGVAMIKAYKWGWFLGTFNHIMHTIRSASVVVYLLLDSRTLSGHNTFILKNIIIYSLFVVVGSWLAMYFFRGNVLNYFDLKQWKKKNYAIRIIVFSFLLVIAKDLIIEYI